MRAHACTTDHKNNPFSKRFHRWWVSVFLSLGELQWLAYIDSLHIIMQIVQISYELYMHSCHQRYTTSEKICTMTNYIPWVLQHAEDHQSLTPPWSMYVLQMAMEERWLKDIWNAALDRGQEGSAYTLAILQFLFLASKHDHFVVVNTCPEKIVLSKQHNQNMGVRK